MAKLRSQLTLKITANVESLKTQLASMGTRANRLQHLMKEMQEALIEFENDLDTLELDFNLTSDGQEDNAREQQRLGHQEEAPGSEAAGIQREATDQHKEAEAGKDHSQG